jgi:C1A family cysteine protease
MTIAKRLYAWKPDVADMRDHIYTPRVSHNPPKVDQIGTSVVIDDQGPLGSCTGNSSTAMIEIILKTVPLSRLMAYYGGRAREGTIKTDSGAQIRDVIAGIANYGVAEETLWPYDITKFTKKPPTIAYKDGATRVKPLVASYQRVPDLSSLKSALAVGHVVTFGFSVPDYFESQDVATNGWVRFPTQADKMIGGHAVVAVGYDDTASTPFVWVRNSWGPDWGLKGYFKMDQRWFTNPSRLTDDMWTVIPK